MGAGRLSFDPKVMISRHQSSESEPIKNSQKLNQKLKISKKHFKNQLKLKESRSSSACGRLPGQKKRVSLCSGFEDWWYWNHPLILSSKIHVRQKKINTLTFTIIPTYFPSQSGRFSYWFFKAQVTVIVVWPLFKTKSIKTTPHIKIHQISHFCQKINENRCRQVHSAWNRVEELDFHTPGLQKYHFL